MSIQVNEFRHIPGKNDAEYIKLLKEHLEAQKQLTFKAIAKIKELSKLVKSNSSESPNGWIPCEERLPEDGERVLCTHLGGLNPNRQVIEHIYQDGKFVLGWDMDMNPSSPTFMQRYMGEVIAWMPFPAPYQPKEDES